MVNNTYLKIGKGEGIGEKRGKRQQWINAIWKSVLVDVSGFTCEKIKWE